MTRAELAALLRERLSGMPEADIERSVEYYGEMVADRMEDGMTEEEAVAALGTPDELVSAVLSETPMTALIRSSVAPRRRRSAWEIVLLVLGSPIWLSLLIALAAVVFSVYVVIWSVIVSLYAVTLALAICALAGVAALVVLLFSGAPFSGLLCLAAGLVCAGLAILFFLFSTLCARCAVWLGRRIWLGIKRCFVGKERKA